MEEKDESMDSGIENDKTVIKNASKKSAEIIKNIFIKYFFAIFIIISIIFFLLFFLGACYYVVKIKDGSWWKISQQSEIETAKISINAKINYANTQYSTAIGSDVLDICSDFEYIIDDALSNKGYDKEDFDSVEEKLYKLSVDSKLDINNCSLAELLWASNTVFKNYLEDEKELEYLINAELITQYPDIDGKKIEESGLIDGIIKFCRPEVLNEGEYLKYVSEETFNELISRYESTGDETVLKCFTIVDDSEGGKVAQIAYGEQEIIELKTNDDNYKDLKIDFREPTTNYTMYTKNINYKELACVDKYTLVFNYLWAFLVITEDYDFVKEIANLAYNSEIEITIYDSTTTTYDVDTYTYTRETNTFYEAYVLDMAENETFYNSKNDKEEEKYTIEYTVKNIIDSVTVILTKADVWVVNYSNTATSNKSTTSNTSMQNEIDDISVSKNSLSGDKQLDNFANSFKKQKENDSGNECKVVRKNGTRTQKIVNLKYNNIYTINDEIYISGVATATEKIENLVEIINKYNGSKNIIMEISSWLIEILNSNENTARLVDLTKYILNKATDGQVYSNEEITIDWKTLLKFDENMTSVSSSGWEQFIRFLHSFEGGGTVYKNENGEDCYKVTSDGGGGSAVGYGVDIATHGAKLRALGYDTSIGSLIPVEIVDAIEEKIIKNYYNQVCSITSGLNLTEYQKYALTSRAYNYGVTGGLKQATGTFKYPSTLTFVQAYNKYYKDVDNDEYYGDYTKVDFNHELFTQYMTWLDYASTGKHPSGWEYRRKAEWCLFQTGYFGYDLKFGKGHGIDEYYQENSVSGITGATDFTNGINLYNSDGSVDTSSIQALNKWITSDLLNTKYHLRTYNYQSGPFAKWWNSSNNWFTANGYKFQCTWYVYGRTNQYLELYGTKYKKWPGTKGNAWRWYNDTQGGAKYFKVGQIAKQNSIAVWKNGTKAGHVAFVEAVDGVTGDVYISHAGGGKSWFGVQKKTANEMKTLWGYKLLGYVYLDSPK